MEDIHATRLHFKLAVVKKVKKKCVVRDQFLSSWKHNYIILEHLKPHFYIVKLGFTEVNIIVSYPCSKT